MKKIIFFLSFLIMYEICHAQTRLKHQKNISNGPLNKKVFRIPMQKTTLQFKSTTLRITKILIAIMKMHICAIKKYKH